jgi:surface polysaccharide O-acyltransferase-like enzyme
MHGESTAVLQQVEWVAKPITITEHWPISFATCGSLWSIRTRENQAYGKRVLAELRELLAIIHRRDTYKTEQPFRGALEDQRYHAWTRATYHVPPNKEAQNLANRFRGHGHD